MENLISDILFQKSVTRLKSSFLKKLLSFRCFKRELKEGFLDKYITNNNWGRLKFLFAISPFFSLRGFSPMFFYL